MEAQLLFSHSLNCLLYALQFIILEPPLIVILALDAGIHKVEKPYSLFASLTLLGGSPRQARGRQLGGTGRTTRGLQRQQTVKHKDDKHGGSIAFFTLP